MLNTAGVPLKTVVVDPDFDLAAALRLSIDAEANAASSSLSDGLELLTLSPLTSLEPSPSTSPIRADSPDLIQAPTLTTLPAQTDVFDITAAVAFCLAHKLAHPPESSSSPATPSPYQPQSCTTPSANKSRDPHASVRTHTPKQQSSHTRRARTRAREKAAQATYLQLKVRPKVKERYATLSQKLVVDVDGLGDNHTSSAFTGRDDGSRSKRLYKLPELVGPQSLFKFRLVKWDGNIPYGLVDRQHRRLIGILAGTPKASSGSHKSLRWPALVEGVTKLMGDLRRKCRIVVKKKNGKKILPRRGNFAALQSGISHGGGQMQPSNVANLEANAGVVNALNGNESIRRVAGFQSAVMEHWLPELYTYYDTYLSRLLTHDRSLRRNFDNSVFPMATYNLGPRTMCYKHTDFANLPFGFCAITPFGTYDPEEGGHLILWEYKLVIEFPPGSTILIPSGVVAHSNVPVGREETRYSMVQYSAGALFRWVDHNFTATETYLAKLTEEEREEHDQIQAERWKFGLSLLPKFEDKNPNHK